MVSNTSGSIVELQLQPGVKYMLAMPPPPPPSAVALPPPETPERKNFVCDVCGYRARDNYSMAKHKKGMHTLKVPALDCTRFSHHHESCNVLLVC